MREMRRAVAHHDARGHAEAGEDRRLHGDGIDVAGLRQRVELHVDDGGGDVLDRREALVEVPRGPRILSSSSSGIGSPVSAWTAKRCSTSGRISQCS